MMSEGTAGAGGRQGRVRPGWTVADVLSASRLPLAALFALDADPMVRLVVTGFRSLIF